MTRAVFVTLVALLCLPAAPAQATSRKPLVGFGEQSPWIFSGERWHTLEKNPAAVRAAEVIAHNPAALQLRYLQTLTEVGAHHNSTSCSRSRWT